jgi:hypothetical protein
MGRCSGRVAAGKLSLCHEFACQRLKLGFQLCQSTLPRNPQALAALQLLPADEATAGTSNPHPHYWVCSATTCCSIHTILSFDSKHLPVDGQIQTKLVVHCEPSVFGRALLYRAPQHLRKAVGGVVALLQAARIGGLLLRLHLELAQRRILLLHQLLQRLQRRCGCTCMPRSSITSQLSRLCTC